MTSPSRDEFEAWLADPVTEFVMAGVRNVAERVPADWFERAWNGGDLTEATLTRLKTRAETFTELAAITVEDAYGANGLPAPPPKQTDESE